MVAMAIVVSDTSPIRALVHLGYLNSLSDLFASVVIPPAVAHELQNPPPTLAAVELAAWNFIRVERPLDSQRVAELAAILDPGEAEAIALAQQIVAEAV
jgi:predicted nucleic acid-binding protein